MRMSFKGMLAAALVLSATAYASNDVDQPAEQGMIRASSDQVANQEGFYAAGSEVVKTATEGVQEGLEVPFVEGKGSPRPISGYAWCLVTKPATYKTVQTECQVRPETWYSKCVPAEYAVQEAQVLVSPAKKVAFTLPAKVRCKKVKVLVEEAQTCYSIIPAEYKWVDKDIEVQPAGSTKVWIPAVYKTQEEKVLVKPPLRKLGEGDCSSAKAAGDVSICVTAECTPAEYITITKEVLVKEGELIDAPTAGRKQTVKVKTLVKPAEVKECVIPAKYEEIDAAEITEPSSVEFKTIPAVYKPIKRLVLVKPESSVKVKVPAKVESKPTQLLQTPESIVWRLVKKDGCDIKSAEPKTVEEAAPVAK